MIAAESKGTKERSKPTISWTSFDVLCLILIISVGFFVRFSFMNQVMRYDESFTFLNYVNRDFLSLFAYTHPNNHVLHTILVGVTTDIFGIAPAIQRVPAFAAGLLSIPVTFYVCRSIIPGKSGYFAASGIAIFPYLVFYSTNARGYTLTVLMTLILVLFCSRYHSRINHFHCGLIAFIASAGMLVMPSMAMITAGVYIWTFFLVFSDSDFASAITKFFIPTCIYTILLTGLFYLPSIFVTGGIDPIVNNRFIASSTWLEFADGLPSHITLVAQSFFRDIPIGITVVLGLLIALACIYAIREDNIKLLILLPCVLAGSIFVLLLKQRIPYVRSWIFLIPFLLILADGGFTYLARKGPRTVHQIMILVIIVFSAAFAYRLGSNEFIARYPDTGLFEDAPVIARKLKTHWAHGDKLYALIPADWPVKFYLYYFVYQEGLSKKNKLASSEYVIEDRNNYVVTDVTKLPVEKIVDTGRSALYRIKRDP